MEIFAHHAHVFQDGVSVYGFEGSTIDGLKKTLDECGIAKAVVFPPREAWYRNEGMHQNEWLARKIKNDDRLYGFGYINFGDGKLADQVKQIAELGLLGIKMHPATQNIKVDSEVAFEVYAEAEKLNLPITFHTGTHQDRISNCHVLLYDEIKEYFPNLRFTLEHVGGYSFFNEAMAVMTNNQNVYAGLTSVFDAKMNKAWYLNEEKIADLLWLQGAERCIFGLDTPFNNVERIKEAIDRIKSLPISQEEMAGIFGGNLKELLGLK